MEMAMELRTIIEAANAGYNVGFADDVVLRSFLGEENVGDTLAGFVAIELKETYDPFATSDAQVDEAVQKMRAAITDLFNVIEALGRLDTED
jgi:hypothetical protein